MPRVAVHINHVAIWCSDIERTRAFYEKYFGAVASPKYVNPAKQFQSYFLSLEGSVRIELMQRPDIAPRAASQALGYAHVAVSVGSEEQVDELTQRMIEEGMHCIDGPRQTGDGYYESVVLDPDGNRIEITV
jgi:lactoylglutathione lyase